MIVKSLASRRGHPIRRIQIVDHDAAGGHAIHVHAKRGFWEVHGKVWTGRSEWGEVLFRLERTIVLSRAPYDSKK